MAPSYMFDRLLNTPLVSSLVFNLRGQFVKQDYLRPCYKHIFLGHTRVIKIFFMRIARKTEALFFLDYFFAEALSPQAAFFRKAFSSNIKMGWRKL